MSLRSRRPLRSSAGVSVSDGGVTLGKVPIAVVGATGYAGLEACRLVLGHPALELTIATSRSQAGTPLGQVYPHLAHATDIVLSPPDPERIAQVPFALVALPSRESMTLVPALLERGVRVIDLSADFRLRDEATYQRHYGVAHAAPQWLLRAVYGLPERHRAEVPGAALIANPGCYPTAAILALAPALAAGLISRRGLIIDAYSGVSGAGREPSRETSLAELAGNLSPYNLAGGHRHSPEMEQELSGAAGGEVTLTFSPHRAPQSRGILATCYGSLVGEVTAAQALEVYREAYRQEKFVTVMSDALPSTKAVGGTNMAQVAVRVDRHAGWLVAIAAIDNLGKGAAGQAVQNLNIMSGRPEAEGLPRIALWP